MNGKRSFLVDRVGYMSGQDTSVRVARGVALKIFSGSAMLRTALQMFWPSGHHLIEDNHPFWSLTHQRIPILGVYKPHNPHIY